MRPVLFGYFGSKVKIARRYPAPVYPTIVEPFAGAAGYSCWHYKRNVMLWDIYPVVVKVISWLIRAKPEDVLKLPLLKREDLIDDLPISDDAKALLGFWAGQCYKAPAKRLSIWGDQYPDTSKWSFKCRRRLAVTVTKIKHWKIHQGSYTDIPVDEIGPATWFVDPPYQVMGKSYQHGSDAIDYKALGEWCRALPGQVIVCENLGADWLPFRPFCKLVGANRRHKGDSKLRTNTEAIWTKNGNEYPSLLGDI